MDQNDEYRQRLGRALYETVVEQSKGEGEAVLIRAGPAFDALMMVAATIIAPDPKFERPDALQTFCNDAGDALIKHIESVRANRAHMAKIDIRPAGPLS